MTGQSHHCMKILSVEHFVKFTLLLVLFNSIASYDKIKLVQLMAALMDFIFTLCRYTQ